MPTKRDRAAASLPTDPPRSREISPMDIRAGVGSILSDCRDNGTVYYVKRKGELMGILVPPGTVEIPDSGHAVVSHILDRIEVGIRQELRRLIDENKALLTRLKASADEQRQQRFGTEPTTDDG